MTNKPARYACQANCPTKGKRSNNYLVCCLDFVLKSSKIFFCSQLEAYRIHVTIHQDRPLGNSLCETKYIVKEQEQIIGLFMTASFGNGDTNTFPTNLRFWSAVHLPVPLRVLAFVYVHHGNTSTGFSSMDIVDFVGPLVEIEEVKMERSRRSMSDSANCVHNQTSLTVLTMYDSVPVLVDQTQCLLLTDWIVFALTGHPVHQRVSFNNCSSWPAVGTAHSRHVQVKSVPPAAAALSHDRQCVYLHRKNEAELSCVWTFSVCAWPQHHCRRNGWLDPQRRAWRHASPYQLSNCKINCEHDGVNVLLQFHAKTFSETFRS